MPKIFRSEFRCNPKSEIEQKVIEKIKNRDLAKYKSVNQYLINAVFEFGEKEEICSPQIEKNDSFLAEITAAIKNELQGYKIIPDTVPCSLPSGVGEEETIVEKESEKLSAIALDFLKDIDIV